MPHGPVITFSDSSEFVAKVFPSPTVVEQVIVTSNPRGVDHRKVVEALYEAVMGAFRTNWHASVLVHYFFDTAQDRFTRDTALFSLPSLSRATVGLLIRFFLLPGSHP